MPGANIDDLQCAEIEVFSGPGCGYCEAAKALLRQHSLTYRERNVRQPEVLEEFQRRLPRVKSIPQIFIDGEHIGGYEDLKLHLV